jgi:2'-hydroxyisoflavone reductase
MRVLILGGTSFVGRTIVEDLLARGYTPTLFNRGRTGAGLFPGVERLVGNRDIGNRDIGTYGALDNLSRDAVGDVCGYVPRHVEDALAALGGRFGRYVFISTAMVYDHNNVQGEITESSPVTSAQGPRTPRRRVLRPYEGCLRRRTPRSSG